MEVEEGVVAPTTLGRIAAYYYMSHKTLAMFGEELGEMDDDDAYLESVTFEKLLEVLSEAAEYDELPVRHNEDQINEEISADVRFVLEKERRKLRKKKKTLQNIFLNSPYRYDPPGLMDDPHCKTSLLLQHHLGRLELPVSDYNTDLRSVLDQAIRIVQAMVDVAGLF